MSLCSLLSFFQFLDSCTMILQLPSAARRLFDEHGEEHFTLQSLKRDQTVFVSCGEGWSDPKLTHDEQQRRLLLSKLSSDVSKIRQYVSQRNPEGEGLFSSLLCVLPFLIRLCCAEPCSQFVLR